MLTPARSCARFLGLGAVSPLSLEACSQGCKGRLAHAGKRSFPPYRVPLIHMHGEVLFHSEILGSFSLGPYTLWSVFMQQFYLCAAK